MYLLVIFAWVPVFGCGSLIAAESREKWRHRRGHLFHEAFWHSLKIDSPETKIFLLVLTAETQRRKVFIVLQFCLPSFFLHYL